MDMMPTTQQRADARLGDIANRSEKGSAMRIIAAETKAVNDKTSRLRAMRLEREAEAAAAKAAEPAKPKRKSRAKAAAA